MSRVREFADSLTTCPSCGHACRVVGTQYEPVHLLADTPSVEPPEADEDEALHEHTYGFDGVHRHDGWHEHPPTADTPSVEPLDVERLARAIHEGMLHNGRGGVDDDLSKRACVQFGWSKSHCHVKARGVAAKYAALLPTQASDSPEKP